jgi:hypothetical protein
MQEWPMRTTLDIETDVLSAAKEIARHRDISVGKVVSELLRQALTGNTGPSAQPRTSISPTGFEPFPARGVIVTNDLINRLRENEGI